MKLRWYLGLLIMVCLLRYSVGTVSAESPSFNNDYDVDYTLSDAQGSVASRVKFNVTITNLKSDVYVDKISLAFPKSFAISGLTVTDDKGSVTPEVATDSLRTQLTLRFNDPSIGRNTTNKFHLEFDQTNLFKVNGNIWEVILPTVEDKTRTSYKVTVHLPPTSARRLAIAKPKPDYIENGAITWTNPTAKTIYAIFGDEQYYKVNLQYHLQNPKEQPVYTEVAFPPDTLYQKIYLNSINPPPDSVSIDDDGNYIGRYNLKAKQAINVIYDGMISLYSHPRNEAEPYFRNQFTQQKSYLLGSTNYWNLDNDNPVKTAKGPQDIYSYVTSTLQYNYDRLKTNTKRFGAKEALANPTQAVCVEFTDTFVSLAREKGIYAREIEGYGFSDDPQLRPLSFVADVLHSWPEYFDERTQIWVPIDPTWEDTSGIDYYSSLDLNHITFAIHGKQSDYPLPAGMYKTQNSKDVYVTAATTKPAQVTNVAIEPFKLPDQLNDNQRITQTLRITNNSNVYLWDTPVTFTVQNLSSTVTSVMIPVLAPYQTKEIPFVLTPGKVNSKSTGRLSIKIMGDEVFSGQTTVIPYFFAFGLKIAYIVLGFALLFIIVRGALALRK